MLTDRRIDYSVALEGAEYGARSLNECAGIGGRMNENRKGTDLCATDEVLIKRANEEFELQLDQWAAEIAAQYSRGSTYIQAGAFLTKVELEDLRKGLYE